MSNENDEYPMEGRRNSGFVFDEIDLEKSENENQIKQKTSVEKDENENEKSEDENERPSWDSPLEFLLSCISMSVGLGNVWRFPFAAYENGGGAFLIPYLLVLIFIGRPIYFMEMCLGQFSSLGPSKIWRIAPFFKGIAYGTMFGSILIVSYYCSIMATTIFFFAVSFQKTLPWSVCHPEWGPDGFCDANSTNYYKNSTSLAQLYYENEVFDQKDSIDDGLGAPEWRLTLCLLLSWIIIFLSLVKGVQSSGKVAYFTAIFPYVVLIILLIRGVTLEGAWYGIKYFITPQWDKIYDPKVWYAAVSQCFFSMGTGLGVIVFFSSYNPFKQNIYRDAIIISFFDTFASLLSGFTIFSILGHLATITGKDIEDVTSGGPGLAFVSYPDVISSFTWAPQLFAVLFFLTLFTLGTGTALSLTGGVITVVCDQFPKFIRWKVTGVICFLGFISGLIYVTPGGQYMLTLVEYFGTNFTIYVMAMLEVAVISWLYGLQRFCDDIEFMLGIKVGWYWKICWGFIIPVGLFVILIYALATDKKLTHEGKGYPDVAIICGWILAAATILLIPLWAIQGVLSRKSVSLKEKLLESFRPADSYGPKSPKLRNEWITFKEQKNYKP